MKKEILALSFVVTFLIAALTASAAAEVLEITPVEDFVSSGEIGGPFTPSSKNYLLTNTGLDTLYWVVDKSQSWVDLDPEGGPLGSGQSTIVTVSLTSQANSLIQGVHTDTLTFMDFTNDEEQTRGVGLTITLPTGIWVLPGSFDVNLSEGCILEKTLTIGNNGIAELNFSIRTRSVSSLPESMTLPATKNDVAPVELTNEKMVLEYQFGEPGFSESSGYDIVRIKGLELYERIGAPIVPVRPVTVLVPFGRKVVNTRVIPLETHELPDTYLLAPAQKPYPLSFQGTMEWTEPDPAIYEQTTPWPGIDSEEIATQSKRGYQLFTLNLLPLQYVPATGKLTYTTKLHLEIDLVDIVSSDVLRPCDVVKTKLTAIVDNPSQLASYPAKDSSFEILEESPLPGGGPYQYVIITNEALEGASGPWNFQALRDARIAQGISATIVTTEWIYANYNGTRPDGGSDNQTRIRNFLIDAYQSWGTEYVLLGGTNSIVPARKFKVQAYSGGPTTTMPVDMYYGCVDPSACTFDHDADGDYGEPTDGEGGGDVDLSAEIYVGRAPVENAAELQNFIKKTLTYASTYSEYLSRIVMVGEYLGFGGPSQYAKNSMEQIRLGGDYDDYFTYGFENHPQPDFYDFNTSTNLYDADGTWPKSELINLMNEGEHVFNHLGHANYTYDMKLYTSDLASLTNTDYFFAYSQGCMPGGFDTTNCFAEVITSMEYGAFAVVMNARSGWGKHNSTDGPSQRFARHFWDAALGEDMLEMGRMNQDSKEDNLWDINGGCIRWCYYELNLFGDPAQQLQFEEACEWLTIDPQAGTIGPGDTNDISVTFDALTMAPGTYEAEIIITSNDPCNPTRVVPATMTVKLDDLQITPADGLDSAGTKGGPFEPNSIIYTLANISNIETVSWTTTETEDWLIVEPNGGILDPCEVIEVDVYISPDANLLDPNIYSELLTFENEDSSSTKTRFFSLTVNPPDCFTELFDSNVCDMESYSLMLSPDGSIAYYEACRDKITDFPTDPNGGTYVALGDDDFVEVPLANDVNVLFYGQWYDRFYIGSNGYITFGSGDAEYEVALENHFDIPRISAVFSDLTPTDIQSISYKQLDDRIAVTFRDVPIFGDKDAKNSFQVEIFFVDGTICISWLDLNTTSSIVGISEGVGIPSVLFTASDLSTYPPCWPLCDFDRNYFINSIDYSILAKYWMNTNCGIPYWCEKSDVDFSGTIDTNDLGILASDWLLQADYWWLQPISHWKFDEGDGNTAYDSVGNNDGTLEGDPSWVAGKIGSFALEFDGNGDYVDCGDIDEIDGTTNLTITAWINTNSISTGKLIARKGEDYPPLLLWVNADYTIHFGFYYGPGGFYTATTTETISPNQWFFVTGTYDGDAVRTYINGVEKAANTDASGPTNSNSDSLRIGPGYPDYPTAWFDGKIDDVRIYDRTLTTEEIQQLYLEGFGSGAYNPNPSNGATNVDPNTLLTWMPGKDALSHDVFLGTGFDDVNDANTNSAEYRGNYDVNSFDPCGLELETLYFWRIDEVGGPNTVKGEIWSFTTWGEFGPDCVSYWKLDEGSGDTAYDSAGNNDGTLEGDPCWVTGKINGALSFDGDDYVDVPDDESLNFGSTTDFTALAWIKTSDPNREDIVCTEALKAKWWGMYIYNNRLSSYIDDDLNPVASTYDGAAINDGQWHHIAVTFDRDGLMKRYVDGASYGTADDISGVGNISNDGSLYIGCRRTSKDLFNGTIDDVRIFNKSLSAEEILQIYKQGAGGEAFYPEPPDEATNVDPNTLLTWMPGYGALSHDVYLGTDYNDVNDANTADPNIYRGNYDVNSFDPCGLELDTLYYWRIDEVNEPNTVKGGLWSFTTWAAPISHWKFDEGSGTDANDSAGNNHGALVGDPQWVPGKIGSYALEFDGSGDYVEMPDSNSLSITGDLSICLWFYPTDSVTEGQDVLWKGRTDGQRSYAIPITDAGRFMFYLTPDGTQANRVYRITGTNAYSYNDWNHAAITYDADAATKMRIYIDGVEKSTTLIGGTEPSSIHNSSESLTISKGFNNYFEGTIDDVRIYDKTLSADEIQSIYQEGL